MSKFWADMCLIPFVVSVTIGGMYQIDQAMKSQVEKSKTQYMAAGLKRHR